ncbi:hypothetical protein D3C72_2302680 [compost metagenome]
MVNYFLFLPFLYITFSTTCTLGAVLVLFFLKGFLAAGPVLEGALSPLPFSASLALALNSGLSFVLSFFGISALCFAKTSLGFLGFSFVPLK